MAKGIWITLLTAVGFLQPSYAASTDIGPEFTNSLGMRMVRISAGSFKMGQPDGQWDEVPVHKVTITVPVYFSAAEVTNAQYEQFDPAHKHLRGKRGISLADDEAVVFVSWDEAMAFCKWLSSRENKPYRLPSEAEWEYACRAGTNTKYSTGDALPEAYWKNQQFEWHPSPVSLKVASSPPNKWGLFDMHGNVEEWCLDWYGPYTAKNQKNPVGYITGLCRVTRGGSHNTEVQDLRSANRMGTLPSDKSWMIGLRVVMASMPDTKPLALPSAQLWAKSVNQKKYDWPEKPDPNTPYFYGPARFVRIEPDSNGPLYSKHNHCPSITWCPNGDLLVIWFSTNTEPGREMTIAASRLRHGTEQWDTASEFFKAPDRNMTGSSLWNDGRGRLFHFNGLEAGAGWANLALVMRTSSDNGVTWTTKLIDTEHQYRNQVISGTSRTSEGLIIQPCDAVHGGSGGTAIHISNDNGNTWTDPGAGTRPPDFDQGSTGGTIAGIHAGVVSLMDGRLLALGRSNDINDYMPMSISGDNGKTWKYSQSEFPPISGGQRLVLMRLKQGPILLMSFTDSSSLVKAGNPKGMFMSDASGKPIRVYGIFAALSFDEGLTWPVKKLITPGADARKLDGGAWTGEFITDATHAEPMGYLAATQSPDGIIHLVSSALYYKFNLSWLTEPLPCGK